MKLTLRLVIILFLLQTVAPLSAQKIIPAQKEGKWGCIDLWDNEVIPFVYDTVSLTRNDAALVVKERGKWKIINKDGKSENNNKYDFISRLDWSDFAFAKQNSKWGVVDKYGRNILTPQFDSIVTLHSRWNDGTVYYSDLFAAYKEDERQAYYKNKRIPLDKYDRIEILGYDDYMIVYKDNKCGVIDTLGQFVVPVQYDKIGDWLSSDGYFSLKLGLKTYYYNPTTKDSITDGVFYKRGEEEKLRPFSLPDCDIYVNWRDEKVFDKRFHTARPFREGVAMVTNFDLSRQCIDTLGNVLFDVPKYDNVGKFRGGLAKYEKGKGGYGLVDKKGKLVIEPKYEKIDYNEYRSYIKAIGDNLIDYYDKSGRKLDYEAMYEFYDEYAVKIEDKWGIADSQFNLVIPAVYDTISYDTEGMIAVACNGKWGYVDRSNKVIIPFIYDEIQQFFEGLAIVKYKGKYGIIDKKNKLRVSFKYDQIPDYSSWILMPAFIDELDYYEPDRFYDTPSSIF